MWNHCIGQRMQMPWKQYHYLLTFKLCWSSVIRCTVFIEGAWTQNNSLKEVSVYSKNKWKRWQLQLTKGQKESEIEDESLADGYYCKLYYAETKLGLRNRVWKKEVATWQIDWKLLKMRKREKLPFNIVYSINMYIHLGILLLTCFTRV